MKTKLRTNKERTSYQLDVVINGKVTSYYFKSEQEALAFQKTIK